MTTRERLENKLERRQEWAQSREAKATEAFQTASRIADGIPLGQPILVGHHSEKRARRDRERIWNNMERSFENQNMAKHHQQKAAGLSRCLDESIFDDDENAVEALEARIAELDKKQKHMIAVNKICKSKKLTEEQKTAKLKADFPDISDDTINSFLHPEHTRELGYPSYAITNNGSNRRRYEKRLAMVKLRQATQARAEESETGVVIEDRPCDYVKVTFAEKPDRSVIDDLRAADFRWGKGSWFGKKKSLPESVKNAHP